MKNTAVHRRSISINGRKTSVSLEDVFWHGLQYIARHKNVTMPALVGRIDRDRKTANLSSAIRIYVFKYARSRTQPNKSLGKRNAHWRNTATSYRAVPRDACV
jgi:predicted DNA-binding ribbon-helix-helix protein